MSKKKWEISDKINFWGAVVNSIIAFCTILALIFAYNSMKISEESLLLTKQTIKESDSTSNANLELTKKSVDAAIRLAQYSESNYQLSKLAIQKSDSNYKKSAHLSEKTFGISEKSFKETVKQFENANTPFLQVHDISISPINIAQDIYISYSLNNLSEIPVKLISYTGKNIVENSTLNNRYVIDNIDFDAINNSYVIKGVSNETKVTFFDSNFMKKKELIDYINDKDCYFHIEREIKYKNLITNKIRFYRFKIKIKRVLGSSIFSENTYFEFLVNDNTDK